MTWIQLRQPNANVPCTPGYCLAYVQDVFGVPAKEPSALADWNQNTYNHPDANFPDGIAVPVWFSGKSGALQQYGHVAVRMPDGSVWSASRPMSNQPMHFASIEALNQYYSDQLIYLGWTEDVEDVKVVEEDNMSQVTLPVARILAFGLGGRNGLNGQPNALKGECDDDLNQHHVGLETNYDVMSWYESPEFQHTLADLGEAGQYEETKKLLDAAQAQVKAAPQAEGATELKPGTYIVK